MIFHWPITYENEYNNGLAGTTEQTSPVTL